jgi:hypothetical protein
MDPIVFDSPDIQVFPNRKAHLEYAMSVAPSAGIIAEFGVHKGTSLTRLACMASRHHQIVGFDSFRGLPSAWRIQDSEDESHPAGKFDTGGRLPSVPTRCILVAGWFDQTAKVLRSMILERDTPIALLHIDSDLCESATTALNAAQPGLQTGSIVVFDELGNWDGRYPLFREGEWKALEIFQRSCPWIRFDPISRSVAQQASFRIVRAAERPSSGSVGAVA